MSDVIIHVENLGKKYIIAHQVTGGYKTARDQVMNIINNVFIKSKRILRGQQVLEGNEIEEFWALKDLNFEIKRGERIGIIGRNGAGKSTLLKILSRITEPTTGKVLIKGRMASLLEVGTGFHPELTGRENIFLNGVILGMNRNEIKKKFDEIVDFSGVEKFLDTPVKRYSSGMYVRLAFAIAAFLEPEILIVDEVLAVGDAEFQKKCLGKMKDVSTQEGRTVLFVSHNMAAIESICNQTVVLNKGEIFFNGDTAEAINRYNKATRQLIKSDLSTRTEREGNGDIIFTGFHIKEPPKTGSDFLVEFDVYSKSDFENTTYGVVIFDDNGSVLTSFLTTHNDKIFKTKKGMNNISCHIPELPLNSGTYFADLWCSSNRDLTTSDYIREAFDFEVTQGDYYKTGFLNVNSIHGNICIKNYWQ